MSDLIYIIPTRGRPDNVKELIEAWRDTAELPSTRAMFVVDSDDPLRPEYEKLFSSVDSGLGKHGSWVFGAAYFHTQNPPNARLAEILNSICQSMLSLFEPSFAIGFMGDDHRPRTKGWDSAILDALSKMRTGIVYCNDMVQGENLPTAVAMTSDIPMHLGYMVPAGLKHMYLDNFWKDFGTAIGRLRYLAGIVIEHQHPIAGAAAWDEGYTNVAGHMTPDQAAYEAYKTVHFHSDVARFLTVMEPEA